MPPVIPPKAAAKTTAAPSAVIPAATPAPAALSPNSPPRHTRKRSMSHDESAHASNDPATGQPPRLDDEVPAKLPRTSNPLFKAGFFKHNGNFPLLVEIISQITRPISAAELHTIADEMAPPGVTWEKALRQLEFRHITAVLSQLNAHDQSQPADQEIIKQLFTQGVTLANSLPQISFLLKICQKQLSLNENDITNLIFSVKLRFVKESTTCLPPEAMNMMCQFFEQLAPQIKTYDLLKGLFTSREQGFALMLTNNPQLALHLLGNCGKIELIQDRQKFYEETLISPKLQKQAYNYHIASIEIDRHHYVCLRG